MAARLVRTVLALTPLAAGLFLILRLMPMAAEGQLPTTTTIWRLDPLALVGVVLLPLAAAWPEQSLGHSVRLMIAVVSVMLALMVASPALELALLYFASLALIGGVGVRWFVALGCLTVAELLPLITAPGLDPIQAQTARLPALILSAAIGGGLLPWPRGRKVGSRWELIVRPVWLLPLLRSFEAGPWPAAWALSLPLLGTGAAAAAAIAALAGPNGERGTERLSAAILAMALVCVSLGTAAGVAAALWSILAYGLVVLRTRMELRRAAPLLWFLPLFIATWWTAAALAGSRAFLPAALIWLSGMICGSAVLLRYEPLHGLQSAPGQIGSRGGMLGGAALATILALFMAQTTDLVALPVVDQLGAGLSAFGLLDLWPWIGAAALDPGHRRVALLPATALVPLFVTLAAITWLLLRLATGPADIAEVAASRAVRRPLEVVLRRVWWLRADRNG